MGRLRLTLLGAPEVQHGDGQLHFPTRKTLAIFIYLVVEGGRHTRDKLVTLFWPDSDEVRGRASLRRALSSVRQAMGDLEPTSSQHILVEQNIVGANIGSDLEIDFQAVEIALESFNVRSGSVSTVSTETQAIESYSKQVGELERVAAACRGEFLEGFTLPDAPEFDAWVSIQREVWHRRVGLLLERLTLYWLHGISALKLPFGNHGATRPEPER